MTVTETGQTPSQRIASEIRAEAARRGVSMRELSRRLGVSQPWVSRRVSTKSDVEMTFEDFERIAEALGTTTTRLIVDSKWLPRLDSNQQPSVRANERLRARVKASPTTVATAAAA